MQRNAVIVAIHAKHSDLEMSQFFNVSRSFVHKVTQELEASDSNVESFAKSRKHNPGSDKLRTPQFVQQVKDIIDEDPSKFIRAISRDLQVSDCTIRRIVYEDASFT